MPATQEQLDQFVTQVRHLKSIDFPTVAAGMNPRLSWFRDLRPHLETNDAFRSALLEVLEEIKFSLLQRLLSGGRGDTTDGKKVNPQLAKQAIAFIDNGTLIPHKKGAGSGGMSPEEEKAHLERLGLAKT